jgi:phage/plasmid-associated DNA primase
MEKGKKLFIAHYMNVISNNVKKLRGNMSQDELFSAWMRWSRESKKRLKRKFSTKSKKVRPDEKHNQDHPLLPGRDHSFSCYCSRYPYVHGAKESPGFSGIGIAERGRRYHCSAGLIIHAGILGRAFLYK